MQLDPAPSPHWMITAATPTNNATANRNADLSLNKNSPDPTCFKMAPLTTTPNPHFSS